MNDISESLKAKSVFTTAELKQLAKQANCSVGKVKALLTELYGAEWFIRPKLRKKAVVVLVSDRPPMGELLNYSASAIYLNERMGHKWYNPVSSFQHLVRSKAILPCRTEQHGKKKIYFFDSHDLDQYIADKSWPELRPDLSEEEMKAIAKRRGVHIITVKRKLVILRQ